MKILHLCGVACVLGCCAGSAVSVERSRAGAVLFEDRFAGPALDGTRWNSFICDNPSKGSPWNMLAGQPVPSSSVSRANDFFLDYDLPSFVSTDEGLDLMARRGSTASGFTWTGSAVCSYPVGKESGGEVTKMRGVTFKDAVVEVSARMPASSNGSWASIWFLAAPGGNGGEIDLHEGGFLKGSTDPDHVMACDLHTKGNRQIFYDTGVSLSAAYHLYRLEYRQGESVKMYFDGKLAASYTRNVPTGPYYIILNNGVASAKTSSWHSQVTPDTASPNHMRVKYVRVSAL